MPARRRVRRQAAPSRNQSLFSTRVYGELVAFGSYVARQMRL